MSGQPILAPGLPRLLRELLTDPDAVSDTGVGVTVTQALVQLAEATTRLADAVERFCDENRGD